MSILGIDFGLAKVGLALADANLAEPFDVIRYKEELGTQPRVWYLPGHGESFGGINAQGPKGLKSLVWPESGV